MQFFTEIPVPIKKSVALKPILDNVSIPVFSISGISTYVFTSDANTKNKINHGNADALLCFLKTNDVNNAIGIIHNARASFIVVAMSNDSFPY